ncbi:MAG: ribosome maturation factor RimM [Methylococcales bacterium]|nr:ribosome maturation factor RimM [Methylococcales bacterium]
MSTKLITLGEISGIFGVHGALKIFSFTEPRENILTYSPWLLKKNNELTEIKVAGGKRQGKTVIARLKGIGDRDAAAQLIGSEILIPKDLLPATAGDEYYWHDLIGLKVETLEGVQLGDVDSILETGANDVLIVKGEKERLIPFLQPETIVNINLETGIMRVDWDIDF